MNILLDDARRHSLFPFGEVRAIAHIRIGIYTIFEKWQHFFPGKVFIASEKKMDFNESEFIRVPANAVPSYEFLKKIFVEKKQIRLSADCRILEYPWHIFENNDWAIREDFKIITEGRTGAAISSTNQLISQENIFLETGTRMEFCTINAEKGPVYIGKNAEIMEGSLLRGPISVGENSVVKMGSKIYGATTIGPSCLAGGEIKNSILMAFSNKAHDGYLGDSVLGEWCNLGAGTSNSNLKNNASIVKLWSKEGNQFINSDIKCGLLMGDYSRSAINTSFNTGTIVGVCCNVFGESFPPKFIDSFTWGNEKYQLDKAIADINNWKKLKNAEITEEEIQSLKNIHSFNKKL